MNENSFSKFSKLSPIMFSRVSKSLLYNFVLEIQILLSNYTYIHISHVSVTHLINLERTSK